MQFTGLELVAMYAIGVADAILCARLWSRRNVGGLLRQRFGWA